VGTKDGTSNCSTQYCSVQARSDQPHGGTRCLYVYNRSLWNSYGYQILASAIQNVVAYQFSVWVKMDSGTSNVLLVLQTDATGSGTQCSQSTGVAVGTTWTQVSANFTPSWSGKLNSALVGITTQSGTTAYGIDDASLFQLSTIGQLAPVPGTWRREVLP
jgi:hypothetical protein